MIFYQGRSGQSRRGHGRLVHEDIWTIVQCPCTQLSQEHIILHCLWGSRHHYLSSHSTRSLPGPGVSTTIDHVEVKRDEGSFIKRWYAWKWSNTGIFFQKVLLVFLIGDYEFLWWTNGLSRAAGYDQTCTRLQFVQVMYNVYINIGCN